MDKIKRINAKDKIIAAAWQLFRQQGYDNTTINDIIKTSDTSRGAFYHHFRGKEDLMFRLAYFFDNDYVEWTKQLDNNLNSIEKLKIFDAFVLKNLEDSEYKSFLPQLYGMQVMTDGTRHIINPNRIYYRTVYELIKDGVEKGEISSPLTYSQLAESFIDLERGLVYNWYLHSFSYSLLEKGTYLIGIYLDSLQPKK
ncbi:MAG: TetR/AcrR family transcriptional regulator [Suipraeoptans sp.]